MSTTDETTSGGEGLAATATEAAALEVKNLDARYGQIQVLRGS